MKRTTASWPVRRSAISSRRVVEIMGIPGQIANTIRGVAIASGSNAWNISVAQYQPGMIRDETSHLNTSPNADRGTIVEQVRQKKGAWTAESLAALLEVSPKLIYKLVKTGKLNAYKLGTSIRIDGHDAANYLVLHATIPQMPLPAKLR